MHLAPLALALLLAAPAVATAQQGGEGRGRMPAGSPFALEGPPAPAAFDSIVGLTAAQRPKYAALHQSYMASTKAARDSVKALRTKMRAAMEAGGGREAAQPFMAAMREQTASVTARYDDFESELGFLLDAPQTARFAAWKEKERARMMEERRARMGAR